MSRTLSYALVLTLLVGLAFAYWAPALLHGQTLSQVDIVPIGTPIIDRLAQGLAGTADLTWAQGLFGGDPLFAESQVGFAAPLNLAVAAFIVPFKGAVYGFNAYEFLAMLAAGVGTLGLCRSLGASVWASGFAAIALALSADWISNQPLLPVLGTLSMAPWCFWAMEVWLKQPTMRSATLFGLSAALVLLGGYPAGFHGTVIYIAARLFVVPFQPRPADAATWRRTLATGAWAVAIGVGAAAIQWLPLLELTRLSVRNNGIALGFPIEQPEMSFVRGLMFTPSPLSPEASYLPTNSVGSALVCALALLALALKTPASVKGHALATLLLGELGMSVSSPLFRMIYRNHLIPGLHFFRDPQFYTLVAIIGVACLAALGADALVAAATAPRKPLGAGRAWGLAAVALVWTLAAALTWKSLFDLLQVAVAVLGVAGAIALAARGRPTFAPMLLVLCLGLEVATLRLHSYRFIDAADLAEPTSVKVIKSTPDWRLYSTYENTTFSGMLGALPMAPETAARARHATAAIITATTLRWDLASIKGDLSLPLSRAQLFEPELSAEVNGQASPPPGARLIDLFGVRWVTTNGPTSAPAMTLQWRDPADGPQLYANSAARPRFQLYSSAVTAASPEAALAVLLAARAPTLVVEGEPTVVASTGETPAGQVQVVAERDASAMLRVTSAAPVWLFMADADYPGWHAFVDGRETPIYPADVLGKAIRVTAGAHDVRFVFRSLTIEIGAAITAVTLALAALTIGLSFRRRRRTPAAA